MLVRLEDLIIFPFVYSVTVFQFQCGAIRSTLKVGWRPGFQKFQFQYGAIRSRSVCQLFAHP